MVPETTTRVPQHTAGHINQRIREQTEANIARYVPAAPEAIDQRLKELDREWDMERTLEANASTLALIGVVLAATVNPWWLLLPGVVTAFLLQHAIQGWCPPMPVFRRLGFRTQTEIDYERYALKALRGDFRELPTATQGQDRAAAHELLLAMQR